MDRSTFQQVGIVDWRRLPLGLLFHLAPILIVGVILFALGWAGLYLIILMPVFAAIIPALLSAAIAGWMRWREPRVAGTVGFALGVIAYLSQYYVWMVATGGWQLLWRLDVVPFVIWEAMNSMAVGDEGVNAGRNWALLIVESCIIGGAFALAHVEMSKKLYCPLCQRQLKKKSSILPPYFATALAIGVAENTFEDLPLDESGGEIEGDAWSNVEVLYCFHGQSDQEPLFYLSLNETRFDGAVGIKSTVLDKVLLSADEMLAIGDKCPGLVVGPSSATPVVATEQDEDDEKQTEAS
jgi:hypothetical protein